MDALNMAARTSSRESAPDVLSDFASFGDDLAGLLSAVADYLVVSETIDPAQRHRALALLASQATESAVIALLPPGASYAIGFFPNVGECVAQVTFENARGAHSRGRQSAALTLLLALVSALQRARAAAELPDED